MVWFSTTRQAIVLFGSKRTTFEVVGQTNRPFLFRLNVLVPWVTSPKTCIRLHCGLHSAIRLRSETTAHTAAGGAAISMLASRVFVTGLSPVLRGLVLRTVTDLLPDRWRSSRPDLGMARGQGRGVSR